jgi:predicted Zn-dependent protease
MKRLLLALMANLVVYSGSAQSLYDGLPVGSHPVGFSIFTFTDSSQDRENIGRSFEIANHYLLQFFNATIKHDEAAVRFLQTKPALARYHPSLWDIVSLPAAKPAPASQEFALLVQKKGFDEALRLVKERLPADSSSNLWQAFVLNRMAYAYLGNKQYKEAIGLFQLNTELHPSDPNLWDSLGEAYEASGDTLRMKQASEKQLALLNAKASLNDFEKRLKQNAERRLK